MDKVNGNVIDPKMLGSIEWYRYKSYTQDDGARVVRFGHIQMPVNTSIYGIDPDSFCIIFATDKVPVKQALNWKNDEVTMTPTVLDVEKLKSDDSYSWQMYAPEDSKKKSANNEDKFCSSL